jgi:arsenical pump membrane protein
MQMSHTAELLIWAISLASIVCMLVRPLGIAEAYWACGGALILAVTRLIPLGAARQGVRTGWNVYLFLAGMMILAELAREEGVFDYLAGVAASYARNSSSRLFVLVYIVGIVVTALLSNDATAVVLTPAVLAVVRRAKVDPKPYLLACAMIANAASFVFPISNPANLVVYASKMPPLAAWLRIFALPSLASIVVTYICLRLISRGGLRGGVIAPAEPAHLTLAGKLALAGLVVAAAGLIAASALGLPLGPPACVVAVIAMMLVTFRDHGVAVRVAIGVSWSVLPLVAGLFVIVEALQSAGLLRAGMAALDALARLPVTAAKFAAAFVVAIVSNGMNNLPVALATGSAVRHAGESTALAHTLLLGVDLGPNLSVTGSLATILWLIALRRENVEITAWEFFKVGLIAMPLALAASLLVL